MVVILPFLIGLDKLVVVLYIYLPLLHIVTVLTTIYNLLSAIS